MAGSGGSCRWPVSCPLSLALACPAELPARPSSPRTPGASVPPFLDGRDRGKVKCDARPSSPRTPGAKRGSGCGSRASGEPDRREALDASGSAVFGRSASSIAPVPFELAENPASRSSLMTFLIPRPPVTQPACTGLSSSGSTSSTLSTDSDLAGIPARRPGEPFTSLAGRAFSISEKLSIRLQ